MASLKLGHTTSPTKALDAEYQTADTTATPPKIVIAVHQGFSIRYLLQTEIFSNLRASGAELVILSISDAVHLKEKYAAPGITFEQIAADVGERAQASGKLQGVFRFIRAYTHAAPVRTAEHTLAIALKDANQSALSLHTRTNLLFLRGLIALARRSRVLRRLMVKFECRFYGAAEYVDFFRRHRPDLVVATSRGTFDFDQYILRAAKRLGVPTAAVILSWDNPTTRGYPAVQVDHTIAWSPVMKWELTALNDVAPETISVDGVAHFDGYFRADADYDRVRFLTSLGLDPKKRTILLATKSPACYAHNPNIAQILAVAIEHGDLPPDLQVLVRIHPLHYRFHFGRLVFGEVLQVYHDLAKRHPSIVLNEPNITSRSVNYDMANGEILFLGRLLRSTNILVNIFSTMNIEAAIYDVPLVNVNFDNLPALYPYARGHRFDIRIDYESDHNHRIVSSGGTRIANNPSELVDQVWAYLENPSLDSAGRRRIVEQEIGPNRGCAGKAISNRILTLAHTTCQHPPVKTDTL